MGALDTAAMFLAALVAGAMNAIAGGGTLLSFPTLLWLGRDPIVANATNAVALVPGSLASAIGFRRELGRTGVMARLLVVPSLIGGALGAWLLLRTPAKAFARIVPALILLATVLFAAQQPIRRRLRRPGARPTGALGWAVGAVFQLCVSVYGGYFGAGMGIVMLAALGLLGIDDVYEANALKNVLAVCINAIAAAYFVVGGAVEWRVVGVMAAGAVAGGYASPFVARRLGPAFVQRVVVAIGVLATVSTLAQLRR